MRPCGLMDKALVFGTKDCRFESCQGHGSATTDGLAHMSSSHRSSALASKRCRDVANLEPCIAEWRSGQRVVLITQRSVDRNHAPLHSFPVARGGIAHSQQQFPFSINQEIILPLTPASSPRSIIMHTSICLAWQHVRAAVG